LTPRSRKYFLAGRGGWMTRWAEIQSGIVPLSHDDARQWARQYLDPKASLEMPLEAAPVARRRQSPGGG
jgi:hypothetical protein